MRVTKRHGRLTSLVLLTGLIPTIVAAYLVWRSGLQPTTRYLIVGTLVAIWLGLVLFVRTRTRYHLRTLSNLLAALREGDFSFRARQVSRGDPFGEVITEVNLLARTLRQQRVEDLEATSLVREVMAEIDVAVFAFDASSRLRQVNAAGEELFRDPSALVGKSASDLGLADCLTGLQARTVELEIDGSRGRWEMRRGSFRQHGRPNHLLVLSDVSRALQAEELAAWKRLIRVIGHELNNSLAPITSLAGSLERVVDQDPLPEDWLSDLGSGLQVIASRVEALNRFMGDCSRLAKLPDPKISSVDIGTCIQNVTRLEKRLAVIVEDGPSVMVDGDQDQLEQVLINLLKNAVEASLEANGEVRIHWRSEDGFAEVVVRDEGPGLPDSINLFVPFFTTKPDGSGIGLFLCRQIAEAHGGSVTVRNREDTRGCEAILRVPETQGRQGRKPASPTN
jgi:nitrogen fixation/metabolism regulation signal transduction histidine kinase